MNKLSIASQKTMHNIQNKRLGKIELTFDRIENKDILPASKNYDTSEQNLISSMIFIESLLKSHYALGI